MNTGYTQRPIAPASNASSSTSPAANASLVPAKRRANQSSTKSKTHDQDDSDDEDSSSRSKRNRMALSCKECKRRKVKCDRNMPSCGPCSKRGQADLCTWDVFSTEGFLPPTIARSSEVAALTDRLSHIEQYLTTLPPSQPIFYPYQPTAGPSTLAAPPLQPQSPSKTSGAVGEEETFSETEDAAIDLEEAFVKTPTVPNLDDKEIFSREQSRGVPGTREQKFGGRGAELTKALTCIVTSERPAGAAPYSKVHLNVELSAGPAEVEKARIAALRTLYRILPQRAAVTHLVELYFSKVSWLFHHIHAPTFLAELEAFHIMLDNGRSDEVDVLWIALLFMVLSVALDSTNASRSPLALNPLKHNSLSGMSEEQLTTLPEMFFQASQRALALGEWESIPRVRSIQTIVLYTQYLQLCSVSRGQPSQLVVWLAGAVRLSLVLGLHRLGTNPETMPAEDPAWPPGKNSLKRESAKRLWGVLVFQDWVGSMKSRAYLISPSHYDTDDPMNVNDIDLSPTNWKVTPAPSSILTDSTSDIVRIAMARQVRKVFDAVVLRKDFSYETVLELDRGYRKILENLPDRWKVDDDEANPILRYQRHFALEGLHNRIFRLHRPFSTRGYRQPKYRYSTDACIQSARLVIISTHSISEAVKDVWYCFSHTMGAALVLFNDLFQAIDADASDAEIKSKRETLNLAYDIFACAPEISSPSLQSVVRQGSKILQGLFRAEESRRVGRVARTLISTAGFGPAEEEEEELETFAEVLQRISRSLNTQIERHRGTPPPTRGIPTASTSGLLSSYPFPNSMQPALDSTTPSWSFDPSANDRPGAANGNAAGDLSVQFFQELGMLETNLLPDNYDFWGDQSPAFGSAVTPGLEPSGMGTGPDWSDRGTDGVGLTQDVSTLLDQLGGGW